jgi:hypothetical protein
VARCGGRDPWRPWRHTCGLSLLGPTAVDGRRAALAGLHAWVAKEHLPQQPKAWTADRGALATSARPTAGEFGTSHDRNGTESPWFKAILRWEALETPFALDALDTHTRARAPPNPRASCRPTHCKTNTASAFPPPHHPTLEPIRYIKERDLDWSYWPLDGQQGPSRKVGKVEPYGLLNSSWNGWAYRPLMGQLWGLM